LPSPCQKLVLDKEIAEVGYQKKQQLNAEPDRVTAALQGRKLTTVRRVGKELLFQLDSGDNILIHLMLTGGFEYCPKSKEVPFAILRVTFRDGQSLVLFDQKAWAKVALNPDLTQRPVDALDVTASYLEEIFKRKPKTLVKPFLLDQQLIAGIGNAYSDEILWHARISPKSVVGKIPKEAVERLASSIRSVLANATDHLRKKHAGMIAGEFRDFLAVHNPKAKTSPSGSPIIVEQVASKKTYFTEEQVLYK
jgi:formamidopyrimidine-DNA glycosylase